MNHNDDSNQLVVRLVSCQSELQESNMSHENEQNSSPSIIDSKMTDLISRTIKKILTPVLSVKSVVPQSIHDDVTIVHDDDSRIDNQPSRESCLEASLSDNVNVNTGTNYQNCSYNNSTIIDNCHQSEGRLVCSDVNLANNFKNDYINTNTAGKTCDGDIIPQILQTSHLEHNQNVSVMSENIEHKSINKSSQLIRDVSDNQPMNNSTEHCTPHHKNIKPFSAIPGPWPSLPFIGTGWQYFSFVGRYDLTKLHEAQVEQFHRYGPILKEEFQWGKSIIHIYDPADFETVFRLQGRCPFRPPNEFVAQLRRKQPEKYPNVGIANLNGEEWFHQRHKLAPAIMKLKTINASMYEQNMICDDFLKYLWNIRDPNTNIIDDFQEASYRLALESICMLCLDSRIGSLDLCDTTTVQETSDSEMLINATKLLFDTFNKLYYGLPFWKIFTTNAYSDLEKAESVIYDVASKYVDKEMESLLNGEYSENKNSVLQTMLNTKGLKKEDIKITIIDFISGGIFTVSNTFVYLIYHLAANPHVQAKLFDEIEHVMSAVSVDECEENIVGAAHIAQMPYLKACVRECFRLNCPVPGIMRVTSQPMVLSGYHIPANSVVFSHLMATCQLENYFKDASKFRPERWIDPVERNQIHPFSLLPFGFGSRMCVGKRFSETELYLATMKLIRTFKIELVPGKEELKLRHAFIVIPAHPISLRLTPRNDSFG